MFSTEVLTRLGLSKDEVATLESHAGDSELGLDQAAALLAERVPRDEATNVDVIVLGSYARLEASAGSDFDYLVVAYGLSGDVRTNRRLLEAADQFIREQLTVAGGLKRPGTTGLFGRITAAADLTERIGLEEDTNLSHSRRLLILEESRSIYNPQLHDSLLTAIVNRYLATMGSQSQVPLVSL